jgi:hypothetical protein
MDAWTLFTSPPQESLQAPLPSFQGDLLYPDRYPDLAFPAQVGRQLVRRRLSSLSEAAPF